MIIANSHMLEDRKSNSRIVLGVTVTGVASFTFFHALALVAESVSELRVEEGS